MAAEWDESCLDVSISDYDALAIIRLQAVCRGWLVRKQMHDARKEFLEIVTELDGKSMDVTWTQSLLPQPIVRKMSKKQKSSKTQVSSSSSKHCNTNSTEASSKPERLTDVKTVSVSVETNGADNSVNINNNKQSINIRENSKNTQSNQDVQTEFNISDNDFHVSDTKEAQVHKCDACKSSTLPSQDVSRMRHHTERWDSVEKDLKEKGTEMTLDRDSGSRERAERGESERRKRNVSLRDGTDSTIITATASASGAYASAKPGVAEHDSDSPVQLRRVDSFLGDQTSVWDSSSSITQDHDKAVKQNLKHQEGGTSYPSCDRGQKGSAVTLETTLRSLNTEELLKQRQNVAMELLWVQQAIISRKKYLKLKSQMEVAT